MSTLQDCKLIITKYNSKNLCALFKDDVMIDVNLEEATQSSLLQNIYVGKVKNIVKNINVAFVEIADGIMCYLPLEKKRKVLFTNSSNRDDIRAGDEILVQVSKEGTKAKTYTATTEISISGKYVALIYGKPTVGISTKIGDKEKRNKLKALLNDKITEDCGFVIRTNAIYAEDLTIINEADRLIEEFREIKNKGKQRTCFSLIKESPSSYISDIKNADTSTVAEITTDDKIIYNEVKEYLSSYQVEDVHKLRLYEDNLLNLRKLYNIESNIEKALMQRVWLKSGAYIVIQPTEAFVAIDVNTGKYIDNKKQRETFLKINLEAAKEISRQIRLRNLSGTIMIDFITMKEKEDNDTLMNKFNKMLTFDPTKTTLVSMTESNIAELTRKKTRKPLHEECLQICNACSGRGMI